MPAVFPSIISDKHGERKKDLISTLGEETFVGRKFRSFLQVLVVSENVWCSRNILISFARESLCYCFLLVLLKN